MTKSATTGKTGELQAATLPNSPLAHVERGVESGRNYKVHPKSLTLAGKFRSTSQGLTDESNFSFGEILSTR